MSVSILRILVPAFGIVITALGGSTAASSQATCPDPIPIGVVTPTTGGVALLGVQVKNGVELAAEDMNKAGGIASHQIRVLADDSGSSTSDALNAVNRLIEQKPLVVFGSMISPLVFTQTPNMEKAQIPFLVTASNAQIASRSLPWLFRTHVHDGQLAEIMPNYLVKTLKKTKPAILAVADDYGLAASKAMQATFAKIGVKPVAIESYGPTDRDMTAQLLKIRDSGADSVVVHGRPADVAIIINETNDLGVDVTVIGNSSIVAQTTLDNLSGTAGDGAYSIGGLIPQASGDPKVKDWVKRVQQRFKVPPDNYTVAYYDTMRLLKEVVEKVGCDRSKIRDSFETIKAWQGMFISYTTDTDRTLAHTVGVYRIEGRQPKLVETMNAPGF